jgi:DNA-binding phage protein
MSRGRNSSLTDEQRAEMRRVRALVEEEKDRIIARGRVHKRAHDAALAEAFRLLRAERESQGLSLTDLETRSGMTRATLCRLENSTAANPTIATLNRYADALGKQLVIGLRNKS